MSVYDDRDRMPGIVEEGVQVWRHKPVIKQAIEWDGTNAAVIIRWAAGRSYMELDRLVICTPQGDMVPTVGDWIVRGVEGAFYPVPRAIFLDSYDFVGGA